MTTQKTISLADRLLPLDVVSKIAKHIQREKRFLNSEFASTLSSSRIFLSTLLIDLDLKGSALSYEQINEAILDLCYELNLEFSDFEHLLEVSNLHAGELALPSPDSPAAVQGAASNSQDSIHLPDSSTADFIARRVKVKSDQPHRGGAPKFPNRRGIIISVVPGILETDEPFFEVRLNSTNRAAERTELFYSMDLEFLHDVAVQNPEQPTPKGFMQTLLDGVYDVSTQFSRAFKKTKSVKTIPDSVPVQVTLFELLKPYAQVQYQNMVALLKSCVNDLAELKNPLSRLSKILGKKRDAKLDVLAKQVPAMSRDVVNYQVMWGL